MEEEVRAAVFGNVGTMAVFRVGAFDAEFLEKEFAPALTAEDLVNLGIFQVYLKLMIDGVTSQPFSAITIPPIERGPETYREEIIAASRAYFARPRIVVEEEIKNWHAPPAPAPSLSTSAGAPARSFPATTGREHTSSETRPRPPEFPRPMAVERASEQAHPHSERSSGTHSQPSPMHHSSPTHHSNPKVELTHSSTHAVPVSPNALSLSKLRATSPKDNKAVSGAHLSELRKALSEVLKSESGNTKESASALATSPSAAREIPEDTLRRILEVKAPSSGGPSVHGT